jgi:hypothetical protein
MATQAYQTDLLIHEAKHCFQCTRLTVLFSSDGRCYQCTTIAPVQCRDSYFWSLGLCNKCDTPTCNPLISQLYHAFYRHESFYRNDNTGKLLVRFFRPASANSIKALYARCLPRRVGG